jgi:hypothetical protein
MQAIATPEPASANAATGTREMPKFVVGQSRAATPVTTNRVTRTERKSAEPEPAAKSSAKTKGDPAAKSAAKAPKSAAPAAKAAAAAASAAAVSAPAGAAPAGAGSSAAYDPNGPTEAARQEVIADAVRLVQWGRKWYELAELIAGMADRPHVTDVRRILKDNKELIDKKAGRT